MCPGLELGRRWGEGQELVLGGQEEDDKKDLLHTHTHTKNTFMSSLLFDWKNKPIQRNTEKHSQNGIHTVCIHVNEYVQFSTH